MALPLAIIDGEGMYDGTIRLATDPHHGRAALPARGRRCGPAAGLAAAPPRGPDGDRAAARPSRATRGLDEDHRGRGAAGAAGAVVDAGCRPDLGRPGAGL